MSIVILAVIFSGCSSISYTTSEGSAVKINRLFISTGIDSLNLQKSIDGLTIGVEGYKNNADTDAIKALGEGLMKGAVKGAIPIPTSAHNVGTTSNGWTVKVEED